MKPPIKKPQVVKPTQCECGDHAWAPLTRGFVTLVSPEDIDLLRVKWHAHHAGTRFYAFRTIHVVGSWRPGVTSKRIVEYLHRAIYPANIVDHKNRDSLDNRRSNLRRATKSQNGANAKKRIDGATSKYKGVSWDKSRGRWVAQVRGDIRGRFDTEEAAARAYDAGAVELYGEFARRNFDAL